MKALYLSTDGDTTTKLPYPLELQGCGCAIIEMNGKVADTLPQDRKNTANLYLCCDIVEESIVGEIKMPVLRYLKRKNGFINGNIDHVIWLRIQRPTISSIRLYIADENGEIFSLPRNKLNCTLLFVPAPADLKTCQ